MADWKPTIADMHKAFAAWRAAERPPVWHPLWTQPWTRCSLPLRSPTTATVRPVEGASRPYVMAVTLEVHPFGDRRVGCLVGSVDVPAGLINMRRLSTVLDGPFRLDGQRLDPPRHTDTDLHVP